MSRNYKFKIRREYIFSFAVVEWIDDTGGKGLLDIVLI